MTRSIRTDWSTERRLQNDTMRVTPRCNVEAALARGDSLTTRLDAGVPRDINQQTPRLWSLHHCRLYNAVTREHMGARSSAACNRSTRYVTGYRRRTIDRRTACARKRTHRGSKNAAPNAGRIRRTLGRAAKLSASLWIRPHTTAPGRDDGARVSRLLRDSQRYHPAGSVWLAARVFARTASHGFLYSEPVRQRLDRSIAQPMAGSKRYPTLRSNHAYGRSRHSIECAGCCAGPADSDPRTGNRVDAGANARTK
jgi:hypothetical protein